MHASVKYSDTSSGYNSVQGRCFKVKLLAYNRVLYFINICCINYVFYIHFILVLRFNLLCSNNNSTLFLMKIKNVIVLLTINTNNSSTYEKSKLILFYQLLLLKNTTFLPKKTKPYQVRALNA